MLPDHGGALRSTRSVVSVPLDPAIGQNYGNRVRFPVIALGRSSATSAGRDPGQLSASGETVAPHRWLSGREDCHWSERTAFLRLADDDPHGLRPLPLRREILRGRCRSENVKFVLDG